MGQMSTEVRKLAKKWHSNTGWPQRIEWIELNGIRGWTGQHIDFQFPFTAIVGENGVGKSTILQAIASIYRSPPPNEVHFASDFFPDTVWEEIRDARIRYSIRQGEGRVMAPGSIHKPKDRWREAPDRPRRIVRFVDLRRIQPIAAQVGYSKIAKTARSESEREPFDAEKKRKYSSILGRRYVEAGFSLSDADSKRWVSVLSLKNDKYSGFHQGAGESALASLLRIDFPKYSVVLIDEIETSLHPRAQRRLVRELADMCRVLELQILVTTHSPYVLEELPMEGRIFISNSPESKAVLTGVSPFFAMTEMDEIPHPDADIFVEDIDAQILLEEMLVIDRRQLLRQCRIIPYGAASVGRSLGIMVSQLRFPRPTIVFLDGDQDPSQGCHILPGGDAPERVVFSSLSARQWSGVAERIQRSPSDVIDALEAAMTVSDHHDWAKTAADRLYISRNNLWRVLCGEWARHVATESLRVGTAELIQDSIDGLGGVSEVARNELNAHDATLPESKPEATTEATEHIESGNHLVESDVLDKSQKGLFDGDE